MEIVQLALSKIKPYKRNPRRNDKAVQAVAESIKQFGWQQPLVVDKDNVLIVGHTRLKAAKKLGLKTAPVLVAANLSEEQVKKYRILDNKTNELSEWDFELLKSEIDEFDLDFSEFDIDFNFNFDAEIGGENEAADPVKNLPEEYLGEEYENESADGADKAPEEEWGELPGFKNDAQMGVKRLVVHFSTWDDVAEFAQLVNQPITENTSFIWFPAVKE